MDRAYSAWGCKESDVTEQLTLSLNCHLTKGWQTSGNESRTEKKEHYILKEERLKENVKNEFGVTALWVSFSEPSEGHHTKRAL